MQRRSPPLFSSFFIDHPFVYSEISYLISPSLMRLVLGLLCILAVESTACRELLRSTLSRHQAVGGTYGY